MQQPFVEKTAFTAIQALSQKTADSATSPGKKAFGSLIKKIEKRREKLAAWETAIPAFKSAAASKLGPAIKSCNEARMQLARKLDELADAKGLSKKERRGATILASTLARELLDSGIDAEDIKAIYNRRSGSNRDTEQALEEAQEIEAMKFMVSEMFGVDVGDTEGMSLAEAMQKAEKMSYEKAEEMEAQGLFQEFASNKKKTPKQEAAAARLEAEKKELSSSLREVYRKLASALHPDRETDAAERDRKNALMVEVNKAYEKKDLLKLLELQLSSEQIDQASIGAWGEDKVFRFNKILREQVRDLDEEIERVEDDFRMGAGLSPYEPINPKTIMRLILGDIEEYKRVEKAMKKELDILSDPARAKAWLGNSANW